MEKEVPKKWWHNSFIFDWAIAFLFLLPTAILGVGNVTPRQRYLPPNRPAMAYPISSETVPTYLLILLSFSIPLFLIAVRVVFHLKRWWFKSCSNKDLALLNLAHNSLLSFFLTVSINLAFTGDNLQTKILLIPLPSYFFERYYKIHGRISASLLLGSR